MKFDQLPFVKNTPKCPPVKPPRDNKMEQRMKKLWAYIECLNENGVDIRCAEGHWMIGDNWNQVTQAEGKSLSEAVDALPMVSMCIKKPTR